MTDPGVVHASSAGRTSRLGFLRDSKVVIYAFLASRLALLAVGLMTLVLIQPFMSHVNPVHPANNPALNIWGAWDTGWLLGVAEHGYSVRPGPDGQVNWVFFPAYPMLAAGLARLIHLPVYVTMLLVSNSAFFAALMLAHRFAMAEFDKRTADLAVALICAVPGSYIYSSAYAESLFLLAVTACLLMLRSRRWLAAGGFAGLAALTRNLGVGLALPIAIAAAPQLIAVARQVPTLGAPARRQLIGDGSRVAIALAAPVIALLGFCLYLYHRTGDPLAFVTAQKAWGRSIGNPLATPIGYLLAPAQIGDSHLVSFVFSWLSLSMVVALAIMRRWSLCALAGFMTLVPLAAGLDSYARYCLVVLPLFLAGAKLLSTRRNAAMATLLSFATVNGFMMVAWTFCLPVTA